MLTAGEFARVIVEQQGIDVVVKVRGADNNPIDELSGGDADGTVSNASTSSPKRRGCYTLTITPADGAIDPGVYTIRLDSRRPADQQRPCPAGIPVAAYGRCPAGTRGRIRRGAVDVRARTALE